MAIRFWWGWLRMVCLPRIHTWQWAVLISKSGNHLQMMNTGGNLEGNSCCIVDTSWNRSLRHGGSSLCQLRWKRGPSKTWKIMIDQWMEWGFPKILRQIHVEGDLLSSTLWPATFETFSGLYPPERYILDFWAEENSCDGLGSDVARWPVAKRTRPIKSWTRIIRGNFPSKLNRK